jgi:hypothetical protein
MCAGKGFLAVRENFGHVAECDCGTIHLTIGPVSVALDTESLRRLHGMLGAAIERLDSAPNERTQSKPVLMHSSHLALKKVMKLKHGLAQ